MARQYRIIAGEWTLVVVPVDEDRVDVLACDPRGIDLGRERRSGSVAGVARAVQESASENPENVVREVVTG